MGGVVVIIPDLGDSSLRDRLIRIGDCQIILIAIIVDLCSQHTICIFRNGYNYSVRNRLTIFTDIISHADSCALRLCNCIFIGSRFSIYDFAKDACLACFDGNSITSAGRHWNISLCNGSGSIRLKPIHCCQRKGELFIQSCFCTAAGYLLGHLRLCDCFRIRQLGEEVQLCAIFAGGLDLLGCPYHPVIIGTQTDNIASSLRCVAFAVLLQFDPAVAVPISGSIHLSLPHSDGRPVVGLI